MLAVNLPERIAHAGGAVDGVVYTNSLQAFDASYACGHRFFELDLAWTADGHLVSIHDWEETWRRLFSGEPPVPTLDEFRSTPMRHGLTPWTLTDAAAWLHRHGDAHLVTDVKTRNVEALAEVLRQCCSDRSRVIAQIYQVSEFDPVRQLGYDRIIMTLYRTTDSDRRVLDLAGRGVLTAVAMEVDRALNGPLLGQLVALGVPVFVHTVNDAEQWAELRARGVWGVFTDLL